MRLPSLSQLGLNVVSFSKNTESKTSSQQIQEAPLASGYQATPPTHGFGPSGLSLVAGTLPKVACAAVMAVISGCTTMPTNQPMPSARVIAEVPVRLASRSASPEQKHEHYYQLVKAAGGAYTPGETHVLALRGLSPTTGQVRDPQPQSRLQDTIVILRPGPEGAPVAYEMAGSTYPMRLPEGRSFGPDVTGDGKGDVGMVLEGNFRTVPNGNAFGGPSYWVLRQGGGDGLPGVRDTNQDGNYSPQEYADSKARGDRLREVLFHPPHYPGTDNTSVNSIGCFNVQDYDKFVQTLGGANARFDVTLVDAWQKR